MHSTLSSPVILKETPPPLLHLRVPVAPLSPMVLYKPPLWHVYAAQVTAGQLLLPLLNHHPPRKKKLILEVLL